MGVLGLQRAASRCRCRHRGERPTIPCSWSTLKMKSAHAILRKTLWKSFLVKINSWKLICGSQFVEKSVCENQSVEVNVWQRRSLRYPASSRGKPRWKSTCDNFTIWVTANLWKVNVRKSVLSQPIWEESDYAQGQWVKITCKSQYCYIWNRRCEGQYDVKTIIYIVCCVSESYYV